MQKKYTRQIREVALVTGPSIAYVQLTQGLYSIIDSADVGLVECYNWCAAWSPKGGSYYAVRSMRRPNGKRTILGMHVELVAPRLGFIADHISGNTLDNRRSNLREADDSQSSMNRGVHKNNTSGVKGVYWHRSAKKWHAHIWAGGRAIHLGLFDSIENAKSAYADAANLHHGNFSRNA